MTVTSSTAKVSYAGNGSTTEFAVSFVFLANSHVEVVLRDSAGTETVWVEATQYTLEGEGEAAGGTLTVLTDPDDYTPASGETLVIRRVVPQTQETDYGENDNFPAETHEAALDKLTMMAQQLDEALARSVTVPVSDTAADISLPIDSERAGKFLAFDGTGQPIATAGTSANLTPVSAFIDTLLDDADAATARATLGVTIGTDVQADIVTTRGDLIRGDDFGNVERLALGASGKILTSNGNDANWQDVPLPRSYLTGFDLTNAADADHDITVAVGEARDSANTINIALASTITKQIDATWAAGTGNGGRSSGISLSADTWYHVFAIVVAGAVDVGFDTSMTAANLVTDHSATAYRRLGSVLTDGSANIIAFQQNGDEFLWDAPVQDYNANMPTTSSDLVLTVPTGVRCLAKYWIASSDSGGGGRAWLIHSKDITDLAAVTSSGPASIASNTSNTLYLPAVGAAGECWTDAAATVRHDATSAQPGDLFTWGWKDQLGRFD